MRVTRWALLVLVGLLVAGCTSPAPLPPTATVALTHTPVLTVVLPTSTLAPTPTRMNPFQAVPKNRHRLPPPPTSQRPYRDRP